MQWDRVIPWVAAAIAVLGWAATHLLSEARERRKEVRSQLDKLVERMANLEKTGREFHMASQFDEAKAAVIRSEIARTERLIDRLGFDQDPLVPLLIDFRRAYTLRNAEKSSFQTQTLESPVLADIADASAELEDAVEMQYRQRYPANFPYFQWGKAGGASASRH